jgi:RES domain-containing protein
MRLWRLGKKQYARSLDGEGAHRVGGRWNPAGMSALYASRSTATATLEVLVHMHWSALPDDYALTCLEIPNGISQATLDTSVFPADWRFVDEHPYCQEMGARWLRESSSLILFVPSAAVPQEENAIINPLHPEINAVQIASVQPYTFDPRLARFFSGSR